MGNREGKVTYLLGAGASAETVPLVKDFPKELILASKVFPENLQPLMEQFGNRSLSLPNGNLLTFKEAFDDLVKVLEWLGVESDKQVSVDTFARKIDMQRTNDRSDYLKLKAGLSIFLIYKQLFSPPDSRYDNFITNLYNRHWPENVNILSWNYDFQLEKAFSYFTGNSNLTELQNSLNTVQFPDHMIFSGPKEFTIYKLNGTSGVFERRNSNFINVVNRVDQKDLDFDFLHEILWQYVQIVYWSERVSSSLIFSWEWDRYPESRYGERLIANCRDTRYLVVIGYSFPSFNREVDRSILRSMVGSLKRIYIQIPKENYDSVLLNFRATWREEFENTENPVKIEPYHPKDHFLIAPEL